MRKPLPGQRTSLAFDFLNFDETVNRTRLPMRTSPCGRNRRQDADTHDVFLPSVQGFSPSTFLAVSEATSVITFMATLYVALPSLARMVCNRIAALPVYGVSVTTSGSSRFTSTPSASSKTGRRRSITRFMASRRLFSSGLPGGVS